MTSLSTNGCHEDKKIHALFVFTAHIQKAFKTTKEHRQIAGALSK